MAISEVWTEDLPKVFQTLKDQGIPMGYLDDQQNFVLEMCWTLDHLSEVVEIVFDDFSTYRADGLY